MPDRDFSNLRREIEPMPDTIEKALVERGVMERYRERPAYQQNDYLSWIRRAKREATRRKRLEQMLDELERGDVYMKMSWSPRG
jgi:uncharacterized protein YdeI (YjbR/CyaY-like superfamily)